MISFRFLDVVFFMGSIRLHLSKDYRLFGENWLGFCGIVWFGTQHIPCLRVYLNEGWTWRLFMSGGLYGQMLNIDVQLL